MLNPNVLKSDLETAFSQIIPSAIEVCMRGTFDELTDKSQEMCSEFAERFDKMVSPQLAERIADIIDKYIKSMCIYGNILTTGTPVTQTAIVNPGGTLNVANPLAGKLPNVLGVM